MTIKILMPALSPTMTEGNLSKWLVNIGDKVKAGDVIAEVETDKATMEVEAVDEGKITHLIVDFLPSNIHYACFNLFIYIFNQVLFAFCHFL